MGVEWEDRIAIDPDILGGKPVVKGTRLAVEFIIELLAQGWSENELLRNYPGLTREDIHASLSYARVCLSGGPASRRIQTAPAEGMKPTLADFFALLDSLDWPDEDFGRDLEAVHATQPKAEFPEWPSCAESTSTTGRRSCYHGERG
jgi:uncharacterized protein (DUF433 family)